MKAIKKSFLAFTIGASLGLAGCASSGTPATEAMAKPSGFLPDYSLLKPVANPPENMQIYAYNSPDFNRNAYHAVIVAPVVLYQTANDKGITDAEIQAAQTNIQNGIEQMVSQKIATTDTPGPGVARLQVGITGAELEGEGFKVRNLVPISAAITLASAATGMSEKKPVLVVEVKFTDSVSGKLLREGLTTISGDGFRNKSNTGAEFEQLAQTWVQQVLKYTSPGNS